MTTTLDRIQQLSPEQRMLLLKKMKHVRPKVEALTWSPLVPLQVQANEPPIYFIHPAGGALFWYLDLLKAMGSRYNAYGLQGNGLYGDQQPLTSITAMAEAYVPLLEAHQPSGPYRLVGYSMGGVIAYEIAQQLCRRGHEVSTLALLDSYLYTERLPFPGHDIVDEDERMIVRMLTALPQGQSREVEQHLRTLPDHAARISYLYEMGRAVGRIPAGYDIVALRRMYEAMDAHVNALSSYRAKPYPGAITFFRCIDRSESDIAAYVSWTAVARKGVQRFDVTGKHSTLLEQPQVLGVADILCRCLSGIGCAG